MKKKQYLADFEWHLLVLALGVTLIGIVFIWSTTRDSLYYAQKPMRQIVFACVSLPVVAAVFKFGYITAKRYAYHTYYFVLFLLVVLFVTGGGGGPADRWFDLGFGMRLQPSELMKVALILALARYLMYRSRSIGWSGLVVPFAMTGAPMILIILQPDLGTALLFPPILIGMLFAAGMGRKQLAYIVAAGLVVLPLAYYSPFLKPYQRDRVDSFLQSIHGLESRAKELQLEALALKNEKERASEAGDGPTVQRKEEEEKAKRDEAAQIARKVRELKRGTGYQQFYSQVSIGSGGMIGQRLGHGPLNRLNYLPESHTDFIFAILGEEWGFLGCVAVLFLFLLMVAIILGVARRTREPFGRYVCCGVGVLIGIQVFVNSAITVGLLPTTGLTLPFMSYGGSSLLTSFLALALVLDVGARRIRVFGF